MSSHPATPNTYPYQNQPTWSRKEKSIARKACDAALVRELRELIQETRQMANQIRQSSDLWELGHHLTKRRKEIDRKYEFRYSRLIDILGKLLHENRLSAEDLHGLGDEKMQAIRSFAKFLRGSAA